MSLKRTVRYLPVSHFLVQTRLSSLSLVECGLVEWKWPPLQDAGPLGNSEEYGEAHGRSRDSLSTPAWEGHRV